MGESNAGTHVANSEISYFPGISVEALTEAIVAYQDLGVGRARWKLFLTR
ncbi:MAG: hypothetical protein CM1200mP39_29820 [Dehalococcoidia bacterium]|nr:MAG: hypothetical protein CM1200mP39_29820 [Dehalococcoidia bacterium]